MPLPKNFILKEEILEKLSMALSRTPKQPFMQLYDNEVETIHGHAL